MFPSSRVPLDFGASRVPNGTFKIQHETIPMRLSKVRERHCRASGQKQSNQTQTSRKMLNPNTCSQLR